ncbi:MAG: hypothetical protein DMF75_10835 [Acidobacteria bacterium]|nr:MAG: hypothetical protein DMF75_10835 [Acidobacteriota bacterium]
MRSTFLDQTPIRMGTAAEFAWVTRTLKAASFDEETICRTFKLENFAVLVARALEMGFIVLA